MDERQEKSILEMGRGAIMERADYEMRAMIRNILDPEHPGSEHLGKSGQKAEHHAHLQARG